MRFSIIMPSCLLPYKNAASDREMKLVRAIESVLSQTFQDFELIVIADGCEKTIEIVKPYCEKYEGKVRLLQITKQPTWSAAVRNAGIHEAFGEIICYCDSDDQLGINHLQILNDNFLQNEWIFFNDKIWDGKEFVENYCSFEPGKCGTSNFAHLRSLNVYWSNNSYSHDLVMIKTLLALSKNYAIIPCGEYKICHRPAYPKIDV